MPFPKLAAPIAGPPDPVIAPTTARAAPSNGAGWSLLGGIGLVLAVVGGADVALTWIPLSFGNPEWEFGTVTATFDSLPVLTLGLGLLLASASATDSGRVRRALRILFGVLAVALVAAGLLYATLMPMVLSALSDPTVKLGLYRAIAKTAVQAIAYPTLFFWIALRRFG